MAERSEFAVSEGDAEFVVLKERKKKKRKREESEEDGS